MDLIAWFQRDVLPAIASEYFGSNNYKVIKCEATSQDKGDDHFTSLTSFVNLVIKFDDKTPETHPMVLKLPPENPVFRKYMRTEPQFYNEVVMYTEAIPAMLEFIRSKCKLSTSEYEVFPKCYFGKWENMKGAVILEDMRNVGFRMCEERVVLDYGHCVVALKALGRYHAMSYGMKKLKSSSFYRLAKTFKETMFDTENFFQIIIARVVEYLERDKEFDNDTLQRFKDHIKDAEKLMLDLIKPKEPLAVLCHGDFCRNNVFFKYDNGKPCEIKFFDFQTVRYASPAIDLTFFCFLNTTSDFRWKHWDEVLGVYHRSLVESLADILGSSIVQVEKEYSFEKIKDEFRDYAF
ncbi:hypothetical protein L9F63_016495 [Diploptera punctata]|uniref:CHK kinase-like domain-containing protein n=1 Tax=Diploptera punctata TaxID=6984 RepID=A0AAD8A0W5_DIPPU|nr:hypothetical protein L9F63_016495 [Diploptera punctata]